MLVVSGLWREGFDEFMDGMVEVYEWSPRCSYEATEALLVYRARK